MRKKLLLLSVLAVLFPAVRAQSLEECRQAAEQNYPIIRQYDLIARTTELTIRNIQKAWFPQISVTAQGSYQNKVTAWPENLQGLFSQMGLQLQGLSRDQYKVGIDVRQTLFDGGAIGSRREIARGEGAVQAAQTEVDLYKIGQRVHEMYFGLLLLDEQLRLNADANALLRSNEQQLAAMLKSGTASAGDFENVKAERLSAEQQQTELLSQRQTLQRLLSLFCRIPVDSIRRPPVPNLPSGENKRPELRLFDCRLQLTDAQEKALDAQLLPQLGLFAQGYYGNPGLNLFEDMMKRRWSWNGIAGLKLTWNLSALYTHRNEKSKLRCNANSLRTLANNSSSIINWMRRNRAKTSVDSAPSRNATAKSSHFAPQFARLRNRNWRTASSMSTGCFAKSTRKTPPRPNKPSTKSTCSKPCTI